MLNYKAYLLVLRSDKRRCRAKQTMRTARSNLMITVERIQWHQLTLRHQFPLSFPPKARQHPCKCPGSILWFWSIYILMSPFPLLGLKLAFEFSTLPTHACTSYSKDWWDLSPKLLCILPYTALFSTDRPASFTPDSNTLRRQKSVGETELRIGYLYTQYLKHNLVILMSFFEWCVTFLEI